MSGWRFNALYGNCLAGDGRDQHIWFFDGGHLIGMDTREPDSSKEIIGLWRDEDTIAFMYVLFRSADTNCCPTGGGEIVLAVRLQELFGWPATPRIAGGRVPIKLELLAPNYRPVQVTSDLASFWANTYFQVRKDLKARYPKHAWPKDPLTAKPEAKGGRKKS